MGVKGGLQIAPGSGAPLDANSGCGLGKVLTWAIKWETIQGLGGGESAIPRVKTSAHDAPSEKVSCSFCFCYC